MATGAGSRIRLRMPLTEQFLAAPFRTRPSHRWNGVPRERLVDGEAVGADVCAVSMALVIVVMVGVIMLLGARRRAR